MTILSTLGQLTFGAAVNGLLVRSVQRLLPADPGEARPLGGDRPATPPWIDRAAAAVVIAAALVVLIVTLGGCVGALGSRVGVLGITATLWLLVEYATRGTRRSPRGPARSTAGALGEGGALGVAAVTVTAAWLALLCERIALPPVAWDALTYHLRFPALWLQTGHLTTAVAPEGDPSNTYYPLVGEMLLYWGLISTGTDLWSCLSQVPFALAGAGALASLASRCGASRRMSFFAALGWLATPGVIRQGAEAMVDVEQAALVLLLLLSAARWREGGGRSWLFTAAASLGLLIGLKYSGLVYAAAAAPVLIWAVQGAGRAASPRRADPRDWIAAIVLVLALGGYSYTRNLVASGNPLLPLELKVGGFTLLHGPTSSAYYFGPQAPRLGWPELLVSLRSVLEMGPLFLPLILALPAALVAGIRQRSNAGALSAIVAGVGLLAFLLGGALLPYREHRYFYAVVALGWCAGVRLGGSRLEGRRAGWMLALLLLVEVPITLFYWGKDLVLTGPRVGNLLAVFATALVAFLLLVPQARCRAASLVARAAAAARAQRPHAALAAAATVPILALAGIAYEPARYDLWYDYWSTRHEWENLEVVRADLRDMAASWRFLAERDAGDSLAIAYAGMNAPYPLMGSGSRHRVLFVPRNRHGSGSFYDWGSRPPDPLTGGNPMDWRRNVDRLGIGYLCLYRHRRELDPGTRYPIEREWAEADPNRFVLIWEAPWARVYRVVPRRPALRPASAPRA